MELDANRKPIEAWMGNFVILQALRDGNRREELHWGMNVAQRTAIENLAIDVSIVVNKDIAFKAVGGFPLMTFCGVAIVIDDKVPDDVLQLRCGDRPEWKITNLAPLPVAA